MARRNLRATLSRQESSVPGIWKWYCSQIELIDAEEKRILGGDAASENFVRSEYRSLSRTDIIDLFAAQRAEQQFAVMLQLLAATEAALRIDFIHRVTQKMKRDPISTEFVRLYKEYGKRHGLRIKLKGQLLETYKQNGSPEARRAIERFEEVLLIRHWLAHGRYWKIKAGRRYGPDAIAETCHDLIQALGVG